MSSFLWVKSKVHRSDLEWGAMGAGTVVKTSLRVREMGLGVKMEKAGGFWQCKQKTHVPSQVDWLE